MAVIGLEQMRFHGPHGFYTEEEILGNEFLIDIYISTDTRRAGHLDDLAETVNYETVYHMVQLEMRKSAQLIEALAQRILYRINEYYEDIDGIKLILRKLNPPLSGEVGAAYIEMTTGVFKSGGGSRKLSFL